MANLRKFVAVLAATAFIAPAAMAQDTEATIEGLVATWVDDQMTEAPQVVKDYGTACITPSVMEMPQTALDMIIEAGGMEAGLPVVEETEPAAIEGFLLPLQECIETLFLGEQIWAWTETAYNDATIEERETVTACMMDVVRPLSTDAKGIIFNGDNFEAGAGALIDQDPDLGPDFEAGLEACD